MFNIRCMLEEKNNRSSYVRLDVVYTDDCAVALFIEIPELHVSCFFGGGAVLYRYRHFWPFKRGNVSFLWLAQSTDEMLWHLYVLIPQALCTFCYKKQTVTIVSHCWALILLYKHVIHTTKPLFIFLAYKSEAFADVMGMLYFDHCRLTSNLLY